MKRVADGYSESESRGFALYIKETGLICVPGRVGII